MFTIISGTNRENSTSMIVARQYAELLAKNNIECSILDLANLPPDFTHSALYSNEGMDDHFNQYRALIQESTKYIFIVPEYNGSFPGVLKAFIDGLKYPESFKHKKCALVGLSSNPFGGSLALSHLTDIFNHLGMHVLALKLKLAQIHHFLDDDGQLHTKYQNLLEEQIDIFLQF